MTNLLTKVQCCGPRLVIIRDVLCLDCTFGLCLRSLDDGFVNFKFMRIEDNLIFEVVKFFKTTITGYS